MRCNSLLLISGAFAGFRRSALLRVGGFDTDCLVEDYELIHRLRRYGVLHGLDWSTSVVGEAFAYTDAPASITAFLRQRRRWFGGFLQTQYWYRDMVGDRRYGWLGVSMLPVKAIDTFQPIFGLTALFLLFYFLATGHYRALIPASGIIIAKIVIDLAYHSYSVFRLSTLGRARHARQHAGGAACSRGRTVYLPGSAPPGCHARMGGIPARCQHLGQAAPGWPGSTPSLRAASGQSPLTTDHRA